MLQTLCGIPGWKTLRDNSAMSQAALYSAPDQLQNFFLSLPVFPLWAQQAFENRCTEQA